MQIVTCLLQCAQQQLGQRLLFDFSFKKDKRKNSYINGSLPLTRHTPKWTKNIPKINLEGGDPIYL